MTHHTSTTHSVAEFFKKYGKHSTSNFQLIKYAKELKIPNFRVYMKDELKEMKQFKFPLNIIINIQSSDYKGIHWSCLYIKNKNNIIFFDSYGLPPQDEIKDFIKKLLNKEHFTTIRNTTPIQKLGETYCGQICLYVLKQLNEKENFQTIVKNLESSFAVSFAVISNP